MTFITPVFFLFLPAVFALHWSLFSGNKGMQNVFLLVASYFFYGYTHPYFALLLIASTLLNFLTGKAIAAAPGDRQKKIWLYAGVFVNLGTLAFFKYFHFFAVPLAHVLHFSPGTSGFNLFNVILPVGISFYTFHSLSYLLDIYRGKIKPDNNLVDFALFISWFPLLVAGPIERATHLLPQLKERRSFHYSSGVQGLRLMLWGLFKKVVIADSLAPSVNYIFNFYEHLGPVTLILGAIGFTFQIYGDFSGYSDIARGVAKLFGIEVFENFRFPLFSRNIAAFWSTWHISLSTWLNDYVFTPLAIRFRDYGKHGTFIAICITYLLSGLWHGAGWHFVAWGALQGIFYLPLIYSAGGQKSMIQQKITAITISDTGKIVRTFFLVSFSLIFFRSDSLSIAIGYVTRIFSGVAMHPQQLLRAPIGVSMLLYMVPLLAGELLIMQHKTMNMLHKTYLRRTAYMLLILIIFYHMDFFDSKTAADFIYFQF